MQVNKKVVGYGAAITLAATLVFGSIWAIATNNDVTNSGFTAESGLNGEYLDAQNYLSDCIVKIKETANVAKAQADRFEEAMVETMKGKFGGVTDDKNASSASPAIGGGKLFSAIVEAYPDLSGLNAAFERVYNTIIDCRTDFRSKQSKLIDRLQTYDAWRTGTWKVRFFGDGEFPSQNLVARIGTDVKRGLDAHDRMWTIVLTKEAKDAYKKGELEPIDPFAEPTTAPTAVPSNK